MTKEEFNRVQWHKGMRAVTRVRGTECVMNVVDVDFQSFKIGLNYMFTYISCYCEDVELMPNSTIANDYYLRNKKYIDKEISLGISFRMCALICLALVICITVAIELSNYLVLEWVIALELVLYCVLISPVLTLRQYMNDMNNMDE